MEKISVIIPTYNHGKFIVDALNSVVEQAYSSMEIIVVDDGSTDNTKEVLGTYSSRISYIYQTNKGLNSARNTGIRASNAKFVAFLDADDFWLPGKLDYQMKMILASTRIGLVGCSGYYVKPNGDIISHFERANYRDRNKLLRDLYVSNIIPGSASGAVIRKECFENVGLFDESLSGATDWEMWFRIACEYDIKFVTIPLVKIRVRADSMSSSINADRMLRNELIVLNKFFSQRVLVKAFFLKRKAYAHSYYFAAIAYREMGQIGSSMKYLWAALAKYPFYLIDLCFLKFLLITIIISFKRKFFI